MSATTGNRRSVARRLRALLGIDDVLVKVERQHEETQRLVKALRSVDERLRSIEQRSSKEEAGIQSQVKDVKLQIRDINEHVQNIRTQLGSRGLPHLLQLVRLDTRALLRRAIVDPSTLPYPQRLTVQRASLVSQREEDGISWAIFETIGAVSKRFIDIGSGIDGGISGFFARECGWRGLMIDANDRHVAGLRDRFGRRQVTSIASYVTRENVNALIGDAGFDSDVDLMSIDIDGMDYWVWEALSISKPRLVIVEYNALFGFDRAVTVPYEATFDRSRFSGVLRKRYYGASLPAFMHLAERKGYRLTTIEPHALNAFFLRNDVGPEIPACPLDALPYSAINNSRFEDIFAVTQKAGLPLVDVTA
jgi:hypothetical protein